MMIEVRSKNSQADLHEWVSWRNNPITVRVLQGEKSGHQALYVVDNGEEGEPGEIQLPRSSSRGN
jgi:hypothetical protein